MTRGLRSAVLAPGRRRRVRTGSAMLPAVLLLALACATPRSDAPGPAPGSTPSAAGGPGVADVAARVGDPSALPTPVLLVGIDGFRHDYLELFRPPHLLALAGTGARAERLVPSFPSKTFPNHYTLVTGLVPDHHGIVSNNIVDPELGRFSLGNREAVADGRWWGGEPIWATAQRAGLPAAALFWPGSEAAIGGVRPTYWTPYDNDLPGAERVRRILDWLALPENERPRFLTLYFSRVDSASHRHGPLAEETRRAVLEVDSFLGSLRDALRARNQDVHWVLVSDHGMAETSPERVILVDEVLADAGLDVAEFDVVDLSPVLALGPRDDRSPGADWERRLVRALDAVDHVSAYRKADLPSHLAHGTHPRIPPVVALADEGWRFTLSARETARPQTGAGGQHGYDPTVDSMGGLLVLSGPRIRPGSRLGAVPNVDVYPLMCELLGIDPAPSDGTVDVFEPILLPAPAVTVPD